MKTIQKVVFLSNFFNHHQTALSDALWSLCPGNYTFVETSQMPEDRRKLGYVQEHRPYVLQLDRHEAQVKRLIREADLVIAGSAPKSLIAQRVSTGKLLFRYSERPLKKGFEVHKYLPRLLLWHWRYPFWKPVYLLCAGAYTARDYRRFGLFRGKAYRWGYFPETTYDPDVQSLIRAKNTSQILWCGRFEDVKRPGDALQVARRLKAKGYSFCLNMIGIGSLEPVLRRFVQENQLEDHVHFLGSMHPEQVRRHMEKAGIFLFTSDRREGWGAVLNESMNSGCAVVASSAAGSVPYLIEAGKNGLVYTCGSIDSLTRQVTYLLERPGEQQRLGTQAYRTVTELWSAQIAAQRLLLLAQRLLQDRSSASPFASGPCSPAG